MTPLLRKLQWWLERRRKEDELREELEFHLQEEREAREADGLATEEAAWAARRELGNATLVREDARATWSWVWLEQLAQDLRYGVRGMLKNRLFTALAALSLALGIGANTAIYSFMDAILLRSLPVADPASLVVLKWRSKAVAGGEAASVMRSMDGSTHADGAGVKAPIFPFPAFEHLRPASEAVLASLFAHKPAGGVNVIADGEAELARGEYVSGDFFGGLEVRPAAGRLIQSYDDRDGAAAVAVLSLRYSRRRFGDAASAIGRTMVVNGVPLTVVGVTPDEFFGVDPAAAPQLYLPMRLGPQLELRSAFHTIDFQDANYYWVEMMGRLKPGIGLEQAQAALAGPFAQWVASTATREGEHANLPVLHLEEGAAGLDSLRRQYSKPLYVLLTMVGLILAIACANTASLLLARSEARAREMTIRLSLGAGRFRIVRQLLTESVLLAALSGAVGVALAVAGVRLLTRLLANGQEGFTFRAELNWHVLAVALALSCLCGVLFGLAPALQATRPALMPQLRDRAIGGPHARRLGGLRVGSRQALVVAQIAISLLLLVTAGLFVRTLSNLQSISLGFNRDNVLLFDVNAAQAGIPEPVVAGFYADLRRRLSELPGVRDATLSHASLIRAGRSHPVKADGRATRGTRILWTGPGFFETMQIPILHGREIAEADRAGTPPVAVVSERFARANFGDADPIGRQLEIGGMLSVGGVPRALEIVGVAANAQYGGLKRDNPPVVYVSQAQAPAPQQGAVTYALRTVGDPLASVGSVRRLVHEADGRMPVTELRTQVAEIEQTINQEIVFARLCSAFAVLALTIACVGLYATMAYVVARRTSEIGIRMALGAAERSVTWMVLREVCALTLLGLAIAVPTALATSRFIESLLFRTRPDDPQALALAAAILLAAALAAGYGPARRASRVDPVVALRHE